MVAIQQIAREFRRRFKAASIPTVGHAFDAVQLPTGNFAIKRVPVFGVCVDDRDPGDPIEFDPGWLKEAIQFHKEQQALGYLAPCHIKHKGQGETIEAGLIGNFTEELAPDPETGELIPTAFCDLLEIPPEEFAKIEKMKVPFRSVEIPPKRLPGGEGKPGFSSLALLTDDEPFWHHPITRVRRVEMGRRGHLGSEYCVFASSDDGAARVLFSFSYDSKGKPMATKRKKKFQDEEPPEGMEPAGDEEAAPEEAGDDMEARLSALEEAVASINEKLEGLMGGEAPSDDAAAAEPADEGVEASASGRGEGVKQFAALSANYQSLNKKFQALQNEREIDKRIASWKDQRKVFDETQIRKEAATFAAVGKQRAYLDAIEDKLDEAPPSTSTEVDSGTASQQIDETDPAVAQFGAQPVQVRQLAAQYAAYWDKTPEVQDRPRAEFVRGIVNSKARELAAGNKEFRRDISDARRQMLALASGREF